MSPTEIIHRRERLYRLLPVVHRAFDEGLEGPLRELLSLIGEQANLLEDDLSRLYDNWFVETCDDWVLPYLGELIGYQSVLSPGSAGTADDSSAELRRAVLFPRREIANTVGYRRRKGSLALLEQIAVEVVGWPARAVEFRRLVAGTASARFLCRRRSSTVEFRDRPALEQLNTAFDRLPRTLDVRRISSHRSRGKYSLPAIGLFAWRRKVRRAIQVPAAATGDRSYTCDTLGFDFPLQVDPHPEPDPTTIASSENLPVLLTCRLLLDDSHRQVRSERKRGWLLGRASPRYYGRGQSVAISVVWRDGQPPSLIPAERVAVADLSRCPNEWNIPRQAAVVGFSATAPPLVALDPELGRLLFPSNVPCPRAVWTTYHYGVGGDIGGGDYDRATGDCPSPGFYRVAKHGGEGYFHSLSDALSAWMQEIRTAPRPPRHAVVEIADNELYDFSIRVGLPRGCHLEIRAANQMFPAAVAGTVRRRGPGVFHCSGEAESALTLSGIRFLASEVKISGPLRRVSILDCTFVPGVTRLDVDCPQAAIEIDRSILGPTHVLFDGVPLDPAEALSTVAGRMQVADSVLEGGDVQVPLTLRNVTVLSRLDVKRLDLAENTIFTELLCVSDGHHGCLRYCFVTSASRTPKRFHCVTDSLPPEDQPVANCAVAAQASKPVVPKFRGLRLPDGELDVAHPDFARLADDCPVEILAGADDQGEMGAFHDEFFQHRAALLRARLADYVPAGCDVALLFET